MHISVNMMLLDLLHIVIIVLIFKGIIVTYAFLFYLKYQVLTDYVLFYLVLFLIVCQEHYYLVCAVLV
jgi:hypothetical protein